MPNRLVTWLATLAGAPALAAPEPGDPAALAEAALAPYPDILVIGAPERLFDISGSAAIVGPEDLRRQRPFTVNEALRQVPGLFPRDEEGAGARPNIGIRGLNPTRSTKVLLLEDGIPLAFAPYGDNASYYHPPLERFDRIEVLKGAAQVRFGPQTIGGVVNYITPPLPDRWGAQLAAQGGNLGTWMIDGRIGGPLLKGAVLLHANHKETDGARANQRLRFTDLFLKAGWELGEAQALTVKLSRFAENSQVTYSGLRRDEFAADPRQNPFVNDRFDTERWGATLAHLFRISPGLELRTHAYYFRFDRDWWRQSSNSNQRPNDASDPACGGMANLNATCGNEGRLRSYDTWGLESRLTLEHATALGGRVGGETEVGLRFHWEDQYRRQWNGDTPRARVPGTSVNAGVRENNERYARAFSGFVQSRLDFGRWSLIPGVRGEVVEFRRVNLPVDVLVGGRPSGAQTARSEAETRLAKVIPGFGVTVAVTDRLVAYGGVHRGFAPPRVEDILTLTGGTVDLDPELSWNGEAGVRGAPVPGLFLDATFFAMDFENQIVPASVAGGVGATLTSAGRTVHRGAELALRVSSVEARLTRGTDLFARAALTWVPMARYASTRITTPPCFDGRTPGTPVATGAGPRPCGVPFDANGNRLPYAPEWLLDAALGVAHGGLTAQVEFVGQGAMFGDDVNLIPVTPDGQRGRIDGWVQINLAASYAPDGRRWEVFATVKNLADRLVVVDRVRGILPGLPRLVQAGARLRF
ncbi:MAG: TonB-dependent receptor [Sphingomonadaceae bacterium]|uniref:TonB-dependent receptor family protein n=1 Tax=Thermaurantiacus sp. TaxID=2820283 RepID=UPI00298EDEE7|nr:TonB-dependent receptor [Thermaurantiacus sp.]MCS6987863.1 TonB-dependent receptor [Sphingomonadaceae bacterium]MDW8414917.1 TonB-dependent receptor [Thermaurantiacus sp.]